MTGFADDGYLAGVMACLDGRELTAMIHGVNISVGSLVVEPGLSDSELSAAEARFGITFPEDLRVFLEYGLPIGHQWPNWREPDGDPYLSDALDRPRREMSRDVEGGLWFAEWGPRPSDIGEAVAVALKDLARAPALVPIHAHRYIPCAPSDAGNPVFSMWSIDDTIYYGNDLADYFAREWAAERPRWSTSDAERRFIPFWTPLIDSWSESLSPRDD